MSFAAPPASIRFSLHAALSDARRKQKGGSRFPESAARLFQQSL
jgi:hypothetical protein